MDSWPYAHLVHNKGKGVFALNGPVIRSVGDPGVRSETAGFPPDASATDRRSGRCADLQCRRGGGIFRGGRSNSGSPAGCWQPLAAPRVALGGGGCLHADVVSLVALKDVAHDLVAETSEASHSTRGVVVVSLSRSRSPSRSPSLSLNITRLHHLSVLMSRLPSSLTSLIPCLAPVTSLVTRRRSPSLYSGVGEPTTPNVVKSAVAMAKL